MQAIVRPRRSVLYMPGSNARALAKARALPADALILDLEDAVAPDAKEAARAQVAAAARAGGYGSRELIVRVNPLATPWGHPDLVAAATSGADAVLLPKVESADAIRQALAVLEAAGAPLELALWSMIETPRAALQVAEIAAASPRLAALVMGTSDLAKELHAAHTALRLPLLTALGLCLLAARAHGLAILDGVFLELEDEAGFEAACRQGSELGFDGKTLIHPKQIGPANEAFAPAEAELARARRLIAAHEAARLRGEGVVVLEGRLIEELHVLEARRLLQLADAIAALGAAAAKPGADQR
jgi:citrate lyase subunit beta/citryl-CoA lyase